MPSTLKKIATAVLLVLISFVKAQAGLVRIDSILSDGITRKYRLYIPNSYNAGNAVPLVINLHGYTSNALQQEIYSNFMPIADTANFLVVCPDGISQAGNQFWNTGITSSPDDVKFISDLIDSLKLRYTIDLNRIYSCGMSNGGIMSYYLACNLSNRIAAIASVTGDMLNTWLSCAPNRPFPILEIHGTLDATVSYYGNSIFAPIDSVVKKWRLHNNCSPSPISYTVPDISLIDNSTVENYKYTGGTNGSSVELFKVVGGSHSWPGALPVIPNTNQDFNASVEIWRFFRQYKLNQFIPNVGITKTTYDENDVLIYPNPTYGLLSIKSETSKKIEIINELGQQVYYVYSDAHTSSNIIDISHLPRGVYFLKINNNNSLIFKKIVKL